MRCVCHLIAYGCKQSTEIKQRNRMVLANSRFINTFMYFLVFESCFALNKNGHHSSCIWILGGAVRRCEGVALFGEVYYWTLSLSLSLHLSLTFYPTPTSSASCFWIKCKLPDTLCLPSYCRTSLQDGHGP